jgi:8-oxo-dGTP pyrophosphatase MutT (NUDIX family)
MKQYLIVVECAIEHEGKFLIIKRPQGKHAGGQFSFPGGKVEEQDEAENFDILRSAVKREIFEEVGLKLIDPINYITSSYFASSSGVQIIDNIFYCKLEQTAPKINASEREVAEYYWLSVDEINAAENSPDWLKKYIEIIEGSQNVHRT